MPDYRYRAVDDHGKTLEGIVSADDEGHADKILFRQGLKTLSLSPHRRRVTRTRSLTLPKSDLIVFTRNIAVLYSSGVPLVEGLADLASDQRSPELAKLAGQVMSKVEEGSTLSEAFEHFPSIFNKMYVSVVRAGEATGALDEVMNRLADHLDWKMTIGTQVKQALVFPMVVSVALVGLIGVLLTFFIPKIVQVFVKMGVDLPAPTRALVWTSNMILEGWAFLVAIAVLGFVCFMVARNLPRPRRFLDEILLRLPGLGEILGKSASAQFIATLKTLYHAGTPMNESLAIASDSVSNTQMAHVFRRASRRVEKGEPLADSLRDSQSVQPLVIRMVSVGEKSGKLEESLQHIVDFYDRDVPQSVKKLLSFMEPVMTISTGATVGFVAFSALLPILRLFSAIKGA